MIDSLTALFVFGGFMPEIDPYFGNMSDYPIEDETLLPEEIESINRPADITPREEFV